ncbi:MAG: glycosyltransferase family 39 protein [Geobacter sp.]|nr:glycosyltransferase family 39 protein [Geobacter sp.]
MTFANKSDKRYIVMNLFIFFIAVYLITLSGPLFSDVGILRIEVAKSIIERLDLTVPADMGIKGADGRYYSWFGIGSVVAAAPFYLLGKFTGIPPANVVAIMNPVFSVFTIVLIFLFSASLGYSRRAAIMTAIVYGLGTMAWYYSKDPGDHVIETFSLLLSVYFMHRYVYSGKKSHAVISGAALGFSFLTRLTAILAIPSLFLIMAFGNRKMPDRKGWMGSVLQGLLFFTLSFIPFALVAMWYNFVRFGTPFESGYGLVAARLGFENFSGGSFTVGLLGLAASPGKGFFYYSPMAILFFPSIRGFLKSHAATAISFVLLTVSYFLFYSRYFYWHGDWAWGPRYLFLATPFLIIPVVALFDSAQWRENAHCRRLAYALFAMSIAIQIAAVSVHPYKYFVWLHKDRKVEFAVNAGEGAQAIMEPSDRIYFDWRFSPISAQFRFAGEMLGSARHFRYSSPPAGSTGLESLPGMHMLDFWWIYSYFIDRTRSGFIAVLTLLIQVLYSAIKLRKAAI